MVHRADYRLNNFTVGLSNTQPIVGQNLALTNYTLCQQYNGTIPPGNSVYITCQISLRTFKYVILQSSWTTNNAICLAEVKVYTSELISIVFKNAKH